MNLARPVIGGAGRARSESMSENITLEAGVREIVGKKVKQLRRAGQIPATLYGPGNDPINLTVPERELRAVLARAGGTYLIELRVGKESYTALARAVQRDPVHGDLLHVDFYRVALDRVTRTDVPVIVVGVSPVVASREGVVALVQNTIEIEALPAKLIPHIEVDVTGLTQIGATLYVSDLVVPDDVAIVTDPSELVLKIDYAEMAVAEEEVVEELPAVAEPEVIRHGKEEEEE
jgi:large subunit ribosomal protein L25